MRNMLSKIVGLLILGFALPAMAVVFTNPKWNGYALDWCAQFETNCGKPAADMYCQKKGYPSSTSFVKRSSVNVPTMTVGSNAICNPQYHTCDSFSSITCKETAKTFMKPTYNGYRLDWCLKFEQNCGAPAAKAFCQKKGFANMQSYQKDSSVSVPTMTIGSNAVCNPQYHVCDSFTYVRCTN